VWFFAATALLATPAAVAAQEEASLTVRWQDARAGSGNLSLLPVDVVLPAGLSRESAIVGWMRPISGSEARWDSLPPGTYRLVAHAGTAADEASVPTEIRELVLAPNDDAVVEVVLPSVSAVESQAEPANLRILLTDAEEDLASLTASQWRSGAFAAVPVTVQSASGGMLVTARAPCIGGSTLLMESRAAAAVVVLDGACDSVMNARLLPRADVVARITTPRAVPVPASGTLRLEKCDGVESTIEIPFVVTGSRMRSVAIAGCGAMSLRVSGFAPVALQPAPLKTGELRDLGTIALTQGAAVAVRVRFARDLEIETGVRVTAVRAHELDAMRGKFDIERIAVASTVTDAVGWARLTGLPEEKVILLLQAPGRTHPQLSEPFTFEAGEETILEDVLLEVPANVFVTIALPDELKTEVQLSAVELSPAGHSHWPSMAPIRADLTQARAEVEDVPPGKWIVRATGRLRNGFALRVAAEEIDVAAGVDRHVTLTMTDRLFRGRVTHRGEPVIGAINLWPAERTKGRHAVSNFDADGRFVVLLENPGDYKVSVQQKTRGSVVSLDHYIAFEEAGDEVSIELPIGQIGGRVIDSAGVAVRDVLVSATQQIADLAGEAAARAAADGSFVLDYVEAGRWVVVAESKNGRSEPVTVVADDGTVDGVTLVLDPVEVVRLKVVDVTGAPVHDVSVTVEFLAPDAATPTRQAAFTRRDGTMDLRLAPWQRAMTANIVLRRLADQRLFCALRTLDADQTITMPPHSGELRLIARQWTGDSTDRGWLLSPEGCSVPFYANSVRESDGTEAMVFRNLAAGRWTYLRTRNPTQLGAVLTGRGAALPAIQTFTVDAGKTTRIKVP
jgi:hypothetical protein